MGNGGAESACGWCKDCWGVNWQITPRVLTEALGADGEEAKRAFEAMMASMHDMPGMPAGAGTTTSGAVGTAAGAGFAGLLYTLLTGAFGDQLLERLFKHVMGLLGIG